MNGKKRSIFDSAIKTFSENGFDGATMNIIAENAGVAKGTLYYYFKSKEEIFRFTVKEGMQLIKEQIDEEINKQHSSTGKLKAMCRVQLSTVYQNREFFKVVMSQLWGKEDRQIELRDSINDYIRYIEKYIKEAMLDGKLKKGEPSFMAYTFFGTMCSAAVYEILNKDDVQPNNVIDSITGYLLKGIEA